MNTVNKILQYIKSKLTTKNIIVGVVILGLIIALFQVDSCRNNKFKSQQNTIDSLTLANQKMVQDTNRLGQVVSKQAVIITGNQEGLKKLTSDLFALEKKDEKRIKQVNALLQIKSNTHIDTLEIAYVDKDKEKRFSDSVEKACAEVISFYRDSSIQVPKHVQIDSLENKDFQMDADITKTGLRVNSVNFPDSQRIAIIETKGGLFRRDIDGKVKFFTPKKLEIQVVHTNKYIKVEGMSSVVYQPKVAGRWLERLVLFGAGVVVTALIIK